VPLSIAVLRYVLSLLVNRQPLTIVPPPLLLYTAEDMVRALFDSQEDMYELELVFYERGGYGK
jgi:hypothetical protein